MTPAATIAIAFIVAAPPIFLIAKRWGEWVAIKATAVVCVMGLLAAVLLSGCNQGPTEEDMAGCAVRGGGPPITSSEVADCAVERAARREETK